MAKLDIERWATTSVSYHLSALFFSTLIIPVGCVDFAQNESYDRQWKALIHRLRRTLSVRVGLEKERLSGRPTRRSAQGVIG